MTHEHNNHEEEMLNDLKKRIEEGKLQKVQAETRLSSYKEQYQKIAEELRDLGIDPKKAKEKVAKMEKEIQIELEELKNLLPN